MRNTLKFFGLVVLTCALTGRVYAAKNVTVRVEQPKSPINQSDFSLNFVALDTNGRDVVVTCDKKGPSDADFVQFSSQTFGNGGNTGNCSVSGLSGEGTYAFRVTAKAGDGVGDNSDMEETSVTYDTSGPGDLRDYSKNKTNSCEYTIHFRTADDNGQTVKVELYRSDAVPFNADNNSRIQSMSIGSNVTKDTTDTPPDCSKTYYYAIRAFDAAGNGSALVGDNVSNVTTKTSTTTGASGTSGAVPVSNTNGNILGAETNGATGASGVTGENGQVAGISTPSGTATPATTPNIIAGHPKRAFAIGVLLILIGSGIFFYWKQKNA